MEIRNLCVRFSFHGSCPTSVAGLKAPLDKTFAYPRQDVNDELIAGIASLGSQHQTAFASCRLV
ncbi:MAG: hypothetical protein WCH35_14865, partial [Comamonadaceae bacterium]